MPRSVLAVVTFLTFTLFVAIAMAAPGAGTFETGPFAPKCGTFKGFQVVGMVNDQPRTLQPGDEFDGDESLVVFGQVTGSHEECRIMALSREVVQMTTRSETDDPNATEPVDMREMLSADFPHTDPHGQFVIDMPITDRDYWRNMSNLDRRGPDGQLIQRPKVSNPFELELVLVDEACQYDMGVKTLDMGFAGGYPDSCRHVASIPLRVRQQVTA